MLRRERLEAEAREPGSHVDRLLRGLDRFDPLTARRLLGNFVRLCMRGRDPDRMM